MRIFSFLGLISILLIVSCNETANSVFSVEQEEVTSAANGSMEVYVDKPGDPLLFSGNLKLVDGQCNILLQSPVTDTLFVMDTAFSLDVQQLPDSVYVIDSVYVSEIKFLRDTMLMQNYIAPADIKFNEHFDRILGDWLFSYEILSYDNIQPYGNFKFSFSYHD